ncbi:hypothetical protein Hypma_016589 [Hypsizygus marmoreus]|uniref:Uncharacterized protein n=1 Tax=Hypsizygus marmoreus TaxID=39966 RepID=A0A369J1S2_HYPMA|nr:hypothetical protein Hypma_016589 [Hypsizygus marmoreus]
MYSAVQQCTLRGSREVYRQRTSPMHALLTPDDELNCKRRNEPARAVERGGTCMQTLDLARQASTAVIAEHTGLALRSPSLKNDFSHPPPLLEA